MKKGFIALTSAVIISAVLLMLATTMSFSSFSSRFNALNTQYKRISLGLAEACVNAALLNIAQNYDYAAGAGGEVLPVGSDTCSIASTSYISSGSGKREFTIITQAHYRETLSVLRVVATAQNPAIAPTTHPSPAVSIISWQEVPIVP